MDKLEADNTIISYDIWLNGEIARIMPQSDADHYLLGFSREYCH
jgi:hypothetical protein